MGYVPAGPISAEGPGAHFPGRKHRRAGAGRPALSRRQLADAGEELAARFLQNRGARIVARNVRVGRGEIDLLITVDGRRIAVEVKTIQSGGLDDPAYAFTDAKAAQVRFLANQLRIGRVDLVAISMTDSGVAIRWIAEVA